MHYSCLLWEPSLLAQVLLSHTPVSLRLHLEGLVEIWEGLGNVHANRGSFGVLWLMAGEELMQWKPLAFAAHLHQVRLLSLV